MFRDEKNLKDSDSLKDTSALPTSYQATGFGLGSYTKTHKLITALYMVTDIIDKDEPLRNKLRTLGAGIISDTFSTPSNVCNKISEIMSFLDIASAINIISEMNCNILRKEFMELDQSIKESINNVENKNNTLNRQVNLSEFFEREFPPLLNKEGNEGRFLTNSPHPNPLLIKERGNLNSKGHTRIGVQKGSTLLKALSKVERMKVLKGVTMSDKNSPAPYEAVGFRSGFDLLKKQRRNDIINVIKIIGGSATIKDIRDKVKAVPEQAGSLVSCGEKTLQRELVSMVKDGVLNKTGEKRWSRYFLK